MSTGLIQHPYRESLVIVGLSAWTAAGDVAGLAAAVEAGEHRFSAAPPYPSEGLSNPRAGQIDGLDRDRPAEALLEHVVRDALAEAGPHSGSTGLVVGTSSGNVCGPWERWHRAFLAGDATEADEAGTGRDAPTTYVARTLGIEGPVATVSVACVSGTAVFAVAEGWLRDGRCDRVVVAGVDALSLFVHAGFSGLGALASGLPRPFQDDRDGLVLGEGAAALVLERGSATGGQVFLGGVGMSADAVHMTAPDRQAGGAIRALRGALVRAGVEPSGTSDTTDAIETISVHGTSTRFNDAMEQVALDAVFGADRAAHPHKQLVKRSIGHTMGAAGAIEAALAVHTVRSEGGALPSMSSAFGGMNACAVFQSTPPPAVEPHDTVVAHTLHSDGSLARSWPDAPVSAKRGSRSVRAAIVGLRDLVAAHGPIEPGTAVVMTTRTGCRPTDLRYHERLVREGAGRVSRLAFTYTVPAAPICEASLHLGLQGPLLTFLGPPELAIEEATRLVRWGHAPAAIAIDIEIPPTSTGAERESSHPVSLVVRAQPRSSRSRG